jgi:hypothetical protein
MTEEGCLGGRPLPVWQPGQGERLVARVLRERVPT